MYNQQFVKEKNWHYMKYESEGSYKLKIKILITIYLTVKEITYIYLLIQSSTRSKRN